MYGLEMRSAELAVMGRPINPFERYGIYERSWVYPVEIEVAPGSESAVSKSPAYAIFVHKDNPLAQLTLKQLDGIFGAQRLGGWDALSWMESAARTSKDNIRTWGQLGLKGEWANRPIHVYGGPLMGTGVITYFETKVMSGGVMWNEDLREYADRKKMIAEMSRDPDAIGYCALSYGTDAVKPLAIAEHKGGPYVPLTRATVTDRTYPLARPVFIDYTIDNEQAEFTSPRGDPRVKEFLRYILSKEGQAEVVREGTYLPLPAKVAAEQIAKLDSTAQPPERELLTY
jgi:phosphate transport system substrate-binding protein